ncbi:Flp pilus assembly complex ATPase component TadA [Candidatus Saccharibacteria bacterium]|jgi:type IV pilus assembly protein PilB|nr:Flp pilus assembly complex ATPase component TadA [Candidatus Saccharibacteria bacterium]HOR23449.1 ATPase, T2SS/T4P/T4SS family [Candidatus Saccharibacteria bacterium]
MRISNQLVEQLLKKANKVSDEQLANLKKQAQSDKKSLQELVISSNLISEKDLTQLFAEEIEIPFIDLNPKDIQKETLRLIPERIARQYNVIVFSIEEDGTKLLAMEDPDDIQAISFLQKQLGDELRIYIATRSNILQCIDQYRGNISSEITQVISGDQDEQAQEEEFDESDLAEDSPIAQTVNLIIEGAIKAGASDVHIEPRENNVSIRYRVDGILQEVNKLPKKVHNALVSRIKILSNLKIDERRAPQDGRFKIAINNMLYALRVSTLPISEGEKVVMRILSEGSKALSLEELGFWGNSLNIINHAITQPHGMILVTGPTGSGKSTTLFSVLSILNKPEVNISTIEDPIEYHIVGANQTQVNPVAGMTFASGLRALLRQDPNIIMIGEIRDTETANLAVQAALTGHLVFATLHTNNAATCLPRLLDMNIEPFLIASTVRAVIGQRLVRRLCPSCRESYSPDTATIKQVCDTFKIKTDSDMKIINELEKNAYKAGIGKTSTSSKTSAINPMATNDSKIVTLYKPHEGGCNDCNHIGYRGRLGIYEALENTGDIQKLIVTSATSEALQTQAVSDGMVTMQLDGLIKALRGMTSIEEILRVTTEE